MVSHDEKIPIRAGFFGDDSEILPEQNQKEVAEKQGYYENQIQKLYERIQTLAHKETTDLNLLWAKTREFINFCNKAGEYFLKVQLFDLAKGNFIRAKKALEKFTANDIQSTTEWKALKITVYRNLSQYFGKINETEKSLHFLKKILPLQQELQKSEILLPGAESLYISMGDLAYKLKLHQDSAYYAELGIKLLEKQLGLEPNTLPDFESTEWPQILKDPNVQMVRARKFIALSYLNYLSGKANQSVGKNLLAMNQFEKAFVISKRFLGPEDRITISYQKKYESMNQAQKQPKEPEKKQKPKSPPKDPKEAVQPTNDVISPKTRFIRGQKREELNSILKEYHSEIAAEMSSIQKEAQQEGKEAKHRSPSPNLQNERQNITDSRLNAIEKLGFAKLGNLKRRQNSATLRSTSLNMSALRLPHDQQSTKIGTRVLSSNQNESAYENNDLMVFDFSTPNTTLMQPHSRTFHPRVGTPSRNVSLAYPIDLPGNFPQRELPSRTPTPIQKTNLTATLNKSLTQDNLPPQPGRRVTPSNLGIEIGNYMSNSNLPVIPNKNAVTPSENETKDTRKEATPLHRTSQFKGSTVLMMASRPSSAATNITKRNRGASNAFQGNGIFPMKIKMRKSNISQDPQSSEMFLKVNEDHSKLDDKIQSRPRSASFFGNKSANKSELNLKLPLDQLFGARKYSEGKIELLASQLHQISQSSKPKGNIDANLIQSQIKNRVQDLSLSSASDLEEILSDHGSELHLKINNRSSSKILDSIVNNHSYSNQRKKRISQGLSNYLIESTKKDLQAYQDQKGSSPRRQPNAEPAFDVEGKDPLPTPGFDHNKNLGINRTDSREFTNSRNASIAEARPLIQVTPTPSGFRNKPIRDLDEFRRIEKQAATKIQRWYRRYKKFGNKKFERKGSQAPFFDGPENILEIFLKDMLNAPGQPKLSMDVNSQNPLSSLRVQTNEHPTEKSTTTANLGNQGTGPLNAENQATPSKPYDFDLTDFRRQKFSESFDFARSEKVELEDDILSLPSEGGLGSTTRLDTSNVFSITQAPGLVRSITMPLKPLLKNPKVDLIKTALMKLNTSDIKFYKNILGLPEFWRVSFVGLEEEGSKYRVRFILKNEFASFDFSSAIAYKTAELSMFYTTIWPLVLEAVVSDLDLLTEKDVIAAMKMESMVILSGFRPNERKSKKLSKEEEAKIRLLLCHITAKAEKQLIFYRSKLNHALVKKSRFPHGDIVKKNRSFLKTQKVKYYRALHALATQMATYNITHELAALSQRWTLPAQTASDMRTQEQESIQSIQPHNNSPTSQTSLHSQRSIGFSLASHMTFHQPPKQQAGSLTNLPEEGTKTSHVPVLDRKRSMMTDLPSKGKPKSRVNRQEKKVPTIYNDTQQTPAASSRGKTQKKNMQEFGRKSDIKYYTQNPSVGQTSQAYQPSLWTADDLALFPSKALTIPNPFLPGEMILQGVIKQHKEFVVFTLKVEYSEDAFESVNTNNSSFELVCEAERLGTAWLSRIPIQTKFISKNVFNSFIHFDQKDFLINSGFSSLQKKHMLNFLKSNLKIQNSKLHLNKDFLTKGFNTLPGPMIGSLCEFHRFMTQNSLEHSYIFDSYEMFVFHQVRRKVRKTTFLSQSRQALPVTPPKTINDDDEEASPHSAYGIRILNPKDPDYGNIASGGEEPFAKTSDAQWLSLYNEIRCTYDKKYYFIIREKHNIFFIRVQFEKLSNLDEVVHICIYQTQTQLTDYAIIRDRETIEKIIIILQIESSKLREKQMLGMLSYYRTLVGNKIAINDKASLGRYTQKIDLLPSNIAQILLASQQDRLSKYGLTIEKVFTKAHIACLGDCYVTATIYKIKEFSGFNDVVCIKFEMQPFINKTKLHKFLINSNDLQFFLDTHYDAIDKSDHLRVVSTVLSRLWLKRQYLYSSLEIPISNHSSLPNSSRFYSLRNTFETKLEQLKDREVTSFGRFLESKIQENVPIIQKLRKINGIFFIITVKKHLILNYWAITLYNPRTCRNFITAFYQSDLFSLNLGFLKQMLPENMRKLEKDSQAMQNYANFCGSYQAMLAYEAEKPQKQFQQLMSFQELPGPAEEETKKFLERMADDFLLEPRSARITRSLPEKSLHHSTVVWQKPNYVELKFWENIVDWISVERTVHGISILNVNEFRGVLREYVYRDIVRTSKTEEALVEIFLEHFKHKFEIEKQLEPVPELNIGEYIFFMRVTSIHNMHTYNNKFNFEQAIKLYLGDKRIVQKPLFTKKKKLNLATVRLIGNYMVYKTKQLNAAQPQTPPSLGDRRDAVNTANEVTPLPYFGLKLNCNLKIQMTIDEEHLFMNKFVIYRSILSLVPLQMVAFVYYEKKEYFTAYIYDNKVSWILKKKIQMAEVKAFIPYATNMIKLGLYQELGSRILKAFKNALIIHSYINTKSEQSARRERE